MPNVVEIIVHAKDLTGEGFGKAEAKATGLGSALTKFAAAGGLALAAVGVESVRMAAKFDQSMEMLSTQAGVPQSKIAGLKAGVLALASQVGFSPDSLAESLYHVASNMASLGATGPQMMNIVKVAAEGARVGGADLVDVTNALTAAVASGIPGVKNYQQAMGMLNATVGAGDMKMQDLAEAFGTGMVAVVKGYGLSLKDVGAALAVFGDNNIRGAHAGTQLRMAVQALAVPAAAGAHQLEALGMTTTQMARDMQSGGLLKALTDLQAHMTKAGITAKTEGQVITTIFGKKAGTGVAILLEQMDRLRSKYPAITAGANGFGNAWQKTLQQTSTVFAQLKSWAQALMISIGEKLLPAVKAVGEWMLRNRTAVELTLAVTAGLVGVLGLYVGIVKTVMMVTKVWAAVQALLNGEMEMNPIGLVVTAIALLVIGLVEAYKHSKEFRDIVHDAGVVAKVAFGWVLRAAEETFDWIKSHWRLLLAILLGPIGLAVDAISAHWRTISSRLAQVIDFIRSHWRTILTYMLGPVSMAVAGIVRYWHDILQGIDQLVGWIRSAWSAVYGILVSPFEAAWRDIQPILNAVQGFLNTVSSVGGSVLGKVGSFFGFGTGGIVGAATGGVHGGLRLVGEYGPELVRLPSGSSVYSNADSVSMGGGGGDQRLIIELQASDSKILSGLQAVVRSSGGDPQMFIRKVAFR